MEGLGEYRKEIDRIDKELTELFEERMNFALKIAQYKKDNNLAVLQNGREDEVLEKAVSNLKNKDYSEEIKSFLNSTMEISRNLQNRKISEDTEQDKRVIQREEIKLDVKVGFPGVIGSFSEEALLKFFGEDSDSISYDGFEDVFKAIDTGEIEYGMLPIENSSTGAISDVYDLIQKYGFYIVGEESIKIDQHLIGTEGATIECIKEVYSHPQGISQSSEFLKQYESWKLIPFINTSTSAKLVRDLGDKSKVAIASKRAAKIYGLNIIKECINDQKNNSTRFVIISKEMKVSKDADKVSVVFSLENEVGFLYNLLRSFAENNINLIKIESRPIKGASWKYFLYVDFEGELDRKEAAKALKDLEKDTEYFKLLGAYKNNIS